MVGLLCCDLVGVVSCCFVPIWLAGGCFVYVCCEFCCWGWICSVIDLGWLLVAVIWFLWCVGIDCVACWF